MLEDSPTGATEHDEVLGHLRRFGRNTNSFLLAYGGYEWFPPLAPAPPDAPDPPAEGDDPPPGVVGFRRHGRSLVVAGDPLCDPRDTAALLDALRRVAGPRARVALVLVSGWLVPALRAHGFAAVQIGADAVFELATWGPHGDAAKKVRNPVNRARRAGVEVTAYRPDRARDRHTERAILRCAWAWLGTRRSGPMGFLSALRPLHHAPERRYFLAWHGGRLVGFVTCSPLYARNGWYVEDVIRRPDAPYGVTELLVTTALQALRAEGATMATLGVAPFVWEDGGLSGGWQRTMIATFRLLAKPFYNVEGIRRYKKKYSPTRWEPVYVAFAPPRLTPGLVIDVLGVFPPGGYRGFLRGWVYRRLGGRRRRIARRRR